MRLYLFNKFIYLLIIYTYLLILQEQVKFGVLHCFAYKTIKIIYITTYKPL